MSFKKWITPQFNKEEINSLADECGYDPFVTLLAFCRGYTDPLALDMFLSKDVPDLDPFAFEDMEPAVQRISSAIENNEKITIFGDYDCDGTTATALMYSFLKSLDADVDFYIPNRKDGYGMNIPAIEKAKENGTKLIITVDNGITCIDEVNKAGNLGIDTIITDHHLPQGELPKAFAIIDPHREDSTLEFKDYAGVGVAFMLALAVSGQSPEAMLSKYGDLAALGTIADVMPLRSENRGIVAAGVNKILSNPNTGIKELLISSGVDIKTVTSSTLAFTVAPRINAAGRMGDASRAVRLLISDDIREIQSLADELCLENKKRQEIEKDIVSSALKIINSKKLYNDRVLVILGENWHEGVLGIAAGKVAERFGKPVILLNMDKDTKLAKGSARSVCNFKIFDAISSFGDKLIKFGGHDMAAGLTISSDLVNDFRKCINEYALKEEYPVPRLKIDCKLNPGSISISLIEALKPLEPYGTDNTNPIFGLFGMKLEKIIPMGNRKHLRLILSKKDTTVAAVMFNKSPEDFPFSAGSVIDLAVTLQTSIYQGEKQINVIVKDIKKNGINDDDIIKGFVDYETFLSGKIPVDIIKSANFDRHEMGEVYRALKLGINTFSKVFYLLNKFSFLKLTVMLDTMEELGLIETEGFGFERKITICESGKVNLESSSIYSKLKVLEE